MDPIKINIEVNLGEATLGIIDKIVGAIQTGASKVESPAPAPLPETKRKAKPAPTPEPEPAPEPEPVEAPASALAADDDLPPDDAPAPAKKTPTEDDARQAVKAARSRGVAAKTIKDFMKETFDIASSVECPAERRQELIDGLNKLAA